MTETNNSVLDVHVSPDPATETISQPPKSYTYYHAGPLFTLAELHLNTLLANAVTSYSGGKFIPVLPQDLEQRDTSTHSIRDQDIRALLSCDLALFTYDGSELDAGTVVEYMIAKMADIPSVIIRTDFRGAGDQKDTGDKWNLMSSFWPRTKTISVDAMREYKAGLTMSSRAGDTRTAGDYVIEDLARSIASAFDEVLQQPSRLPKALRKGVYEWLALMPGYREGDDQHNIEFMSKLCDDKEAKGLL